MECENIAVNLNNNSKLIQLWIESLSYGSNYTLMRLRKVEATLRIPHSNMYKHEYKARNFVLCCICINYYINICVVM